MIDRYQEWINHVFNHPVHDPQWYFDVDAPKFEVSDIEFTSLFIKTMDRCGIDLLQFDDAQVNQGLWYIFLNACSDYMFQLKSVSVPREDKARAIVAIKHLYSDCFEKRCTPTLSHLDEPSSPLNDICYMLWDITPLNYWEGSDDKEFLYEQVVEVLAFALKSPNIACVESALHGLGHTQMEAPKLVEQVLDEFLGENKLLSEDLVSYAEIAKTGYIM
ncbi:hypothetical protein [Calothrix sp. 336/3]|uniref:hypothetical protein n=1 Tax=Calothrix sp. 336/3 TaxID=1337936 RepID=UPI0004E2AF2C|nr:hypothetical protein [Calothrix sp. 336/3]AKG24864.1 hypothetical protein IJ00_26260 [Calothrix sp. 336/3]